MMPGRPESVALRNVLDARVRVDARETRSPRRRVPFNSSTSSVFKWERVPAGSSLFEKTAVGAEYSTALARPRQHLFFGRQHHARPDEPGPRVVDADRDERPGFVADAHQTAVLPPARAGGR